MRFSKIVPLKVFFHRYDGIYKCVRYWPQKGASGFIVWRYEMRRDDPTPSPWSKEGKKRMEEMGMVSALVSFPDAIITHLPLTFPIE